MFPILIYDLPAKRILLAMVCCLISICCQPGPCLAGIPSTTADKAATAAAEQHFRMGVTLFQNGRPKEAIEEYLGAVNARPDFANAWYNLGQLYAATGDLGEAKVAMNKYLELVPAGSRADYLKTLLPYMEQVASRPPVSKDLPDYVEQLKPEERPTWPADKSTIAVCLLSGDAVPGFRPEYNQEVRDAFQAWEKATDGAITFIFVDDFKRADITLGWTDKPNIATMKTEVGDCRLILKPDTQEVTRALIVLMTKPPLLEMNSIQARNVALHEIGHSLGIYGHSNNPADVMYFFSLPDNRKHVLSDRDVNTIRKLYPKTP